MEEAGAAPAEAADAGGRVAVDTGGLKVRGVNAADGRRVGDGMPEHATLQDLDLAPDLESACALPEEMPAGIAETLAGFDIFRGVEPEAITWLVENSRCTRYAASAAVARPGEEVSVMGVILEGSLRFFRETNKGYQDLGASVRGETYGKLPFSRMTHATGLVRADEETLLLELPEDCFTEMVTVSYKLVQNLVATMSDRIRECRPAARRPPRR